MTPELKAYLEHWLEWAENGAKDNSPYCTYWGLCVSVDNYTSDTDLELLIWRELRNVLQDEFPNAEGMSGASYPFGGRDAYYADEAFPIRLEWVRSKLNV